MRLSFYKKKLSGAAMIISFNLCTLCVYTHNKMKNNPHTHDVFGTQTRIDAHGIASLRVRRRFVRPAEINVAHAKL